MNNFLSPFSKNILKETGNMIKVFIAGRYSMRHFLYPKILILNDIPCTPTTPSTRSGMGFHLVCHCWERTSMFSLPYFSLHDCLKYSSSSVPRSQHFGFSLGSSGLLEGKKKKIHVQTLVPRSRFIIFQGPFYKKSSFKLLVSWIRWNEGGFYFRSLPSWRDIIIT
jgi:hypothetical protein